MSERPTAEQLLERPHAMLTRSHLRELGLGRNAIDAIFRALPVFVPRVLPADGPRGGLPGFRGRAHLRG